MFGIGIPELILILIVGLIVFGPSKLPEVGRAVGKGLREFKKASSALQATLNAPDPEPHPTATDNPASAPCPATTKTQAATIAADYTPPTQESVQEKLQANKESASLKTA